MQHGSDMKLNIALMFWQTPQAEITVELHDRDIDNPEQSNLIGTAFVIPDPTVKQVKVEALSIDQILGVKKDTVAVRPYGTLTFNLEPGRFMIPFKPVQSRDSVVLAGAYILAGTYMTVEMEVMKDTVPVMALPPVSTPPTKTRGGNEKSHSKEDKTPPKPVYTMSRLVFITHGELSEQEKHFMADIQTKIVKFNAQAFEQKDIACVPSMKIEKEECGAISGFIMISEEFEITILELVNDSPACEDLLNVARQALENKEKYKRHVSEDGTEEYDPDEPPYIPNITIISDPSIVYKSPRLYGGFDCAVKKFKLALPLSQLLLDPQLYVQNSHLSNCFTIASKLQKMQNARSLAEFDKEDYWPTQPELEMLNAKKGCLLSLDELAFPPRLENDPEVIRMRSRINSTISLVEEEQEPLEYVPLKMSPREPCNRDLNYYVTRNIETIRMLEQKRKVDPNIITSADDGETMVVNKGEPIPEGYVAEEPEPFESLAEMTKGPKFQKLFRAENGTEIRGGHKFYCYNSPKTVLGETKDLKVDVNHDPWDKGDMPLANAETRHFNNIRGPIYTDYDTVLKEGGYFDPYPGNVNDTYNDKINRDPVFLTKAMAHPERFGTIVVPAGKNEELLGRTTLPPTLQISEKFVSAEERARQRTREENAFVAKMEKEGKRRFNTLFKPQLKKGTTDSAYVAKIVPTFPSPKPTF